MKFYENYRAELAKITADDAADVAALMGLQVRGTGIQKMPQKVPLSHAAYVVPGLIQNGHGRISVLLEHRL